MRGLTFLIGCLIALSTGGAQASNIFPLAFGMTPTEVSVALSAPLVLMKARGHSEIYFAERDAGIPGFYPSRERIMLQFRRGGLTGWKKNWDVAKPGWLF